MWPRSSAPRHFAKDVFHEFHRFADSRSAHHGSCSTTSRSSRKSFWDYLDILVTNDRIEQGRALLERYRNAFDAVERAYRR